MYRRNDELAIPTDALIRLASPDLDAGADPAPRGSPTRTLPGRLRARPRSRSSAEVDKEALAGVCSSPIHPISRKAIFRVDPIGADYLTAREDRREMPTGARTGTICVLYRVPLSRSLIG